MKLFHRLLCAALLGGCLLAGPSSQAADGVPVTFELPPAPGQTYLVTLAVVDPKRPDWIVSTFVAGTPFTVTAENKGRFSATWDGLDENFMPVPPGDYAVKGIYAPARTWAVDGEWHAVTPRFAGGASPWLPSPDRWELPVPFGGDPVNAPLQDVAVGPNGVAVFYYQYLENGTNCPMFDLNKPVGYEQFIRAFSSGGAGGGPAAATDGQMVWAFSTDGGPRFVYRADQKSFGQSPGANRRNSYLPEGWVTAMAVAEGNPEGRRLVYVAQRGKILQEATNRGSHGFRYLESDTDFVDQITVHDGENGTVLTTVKLARPKSLVVQGGRLHAMHEVEGKFVVSTLKLKDGLPDGGWTQAFQVMDKLQPADMECDAAGRYYFSDMAANKVYQCDARGKILRAFGRLDRQVSGSYDRETLMAPSKLATWRDAQGRDRLLIVEMEGPNRVSEWAADDGSLIREFMSHQTKCNSGYAIDPADASAVYLPGQGSWLTRFKVNYPTGEWKVDAVWPDVEGGQRRGLEKPVAIRTHNQLYLASEKNLSVYRLAGDRWKKSAGLIVQEDKRAFLWHDANDNGEPDAAEQTPVEVPRGIITYHGQRWLDDLSYIAPSQGGTEVWRLAPEGFDSHGNPIFKAFQKVLQDPVFASRVAGKADAVHGGNEMADNYSSDWMQVDGSMKDGLYVQARGGKNFDANRGP
ncbi:MAG: hypothetical protein ACAI34_03295, partial [Verrucomicrobium sp.]